MRGGRFEKKVLWLLIGPCDNIFRDTMVVTAVTNLSACSVLPVLSCPRWLSPSRSLDEVARHSNQQSQGEAEREGVVKFS